MSRLLRTVARGIALPLLLGCAYHDPEAEAQAKLFATRMGVQHYECGETSWADATFCNGVMGGRPVKFLCGNDGCSWSR